MFLAARKRRLGGERGGTATEKIEFRDPGGCRGEGGRNGRVEGRMLN